MLFKNIFILSYVISVFLCIVILAKYRFDDFVMRNWMTGKNYVFSDLFALYVACIPIINMVIIGLFLLYEVSKIALKSYPEKLDNFIKMTDDVFHDHMKNIGLHVYYPLVSIIGSAVWGYGFTMIKHPSQIVVYLLPCTSWTMLIDRMF